MYKRPNRLHSPPCSSNDLMAHAKNNAGGLVVGVKAIHLVKHLRWNRRGERGPCPQVRG
jgi:hypothetical protein